MGSLSDRSYNATAYGRMALVALGLLALVGAAGGAVWWYERNVEAERVLRDRFRDPQGEAGIATARVAHLGPQAVPVLAEDLKSPDQDKRLKAMEMLGAIDDPRVVPTLAALLKDPDLGLRLSGIAALARTGRPEAVAPLMAQTQSADDLERWRAIVALGLVASAAEYDQLEAALAKARGLDKQLFGWSLGHAQRRQESLKGGHRGFLAAAPDPVDAADAARLRARLREVKDAIAAGTAVRANARALSELTSISFAGWDIGHAISLQVMAVDDPEQFRAATLQQDAQPAAKGGVILQGGSRAQPQTP